MKKLSRFVFGLGLALAVVSLQGCMTMMSAVEGQSRVFSIHHEKTNVDLVQLDIVSWRFLTMYSKLSLGVGKIADSTKAEALRFVLLGEGAGLLSDDEALESVRFTVDGKDFNGIDVAKLPVDYPTRDDGTKSSVGSQAAQFAIKGDVLPYNQTNQALKELYHSLSTAKEVKIGLFTKDGHHNRDKTYTLSPEDMKLLPEWVAQVEAKFGKI